MTDTTYQDGSSSRVEYLISDGDVILAVNDAFKSFADDNNAKGLHDQVVGKSIWNYMYTDEVNMVYKKLFDAVRASGKDVSITFRCDSHDVLRFMTLHIRYATDRQLKISTELVREVPRARVLSSVILYTGIKDGLPMCSHCNRLYLQKLKAWIEVDRAIEQQMINDRLSVTFTLCGNCIGEFKSTIRSLTTTA